MVKPSIEDRAFKKYGKSGKQEFMNYPQIDPVLINIAGPLALRWYSLMYILGFACVAWLGIRRSRTLHPDWEKDHVFDLVFYGAMGAILGGRIGYVLFYNFEVFLTQPLYLLKVWEGGMSFHGGLLGVLLAMFFYSKKLKRSFWTVTDFLAPLCPIGLGLGRLGNFINVELPGRVSESGFGLRYPCEKVTSINPICIGQWEGSLRYPSPLIQAFFEGFLLFVILWFFSAKKRSLGKVSAMFLICYGSFRVLTEFFRTPDSHLGFVLFGAVTMGQILSAPLIIAGMILWFWSKTNGEAKI